MYVEFMKKFSLADSSELIAVRLISASWAQKGLIPTVWTWCTSSSWKIFYSPIRASWLLLDSFLPPQPRNVWFLLSRHDVRSSSWKIFLLPIRASGWLLDSFRPPELKNVWFLLSRLDVRRVHEKVLSRRFERADGCWTHLGLLSPKRFHSYCLDMMYVDFMKNFLLPIRASWSLLDSFRPPERKNVWFPLSSHDVRRVHEKFCFRRFERDDGF